MKKVSSQMHYQRTMRYKVHLLLIFAYAIVVQFGNLFRLSGTEETGIGLPTFIAVTIIMLGGLNALNNFLSNKTLYLFLFVALWALFADFVSTYTSENAFYSPIVYILYALMAASVMKVFAVDDSLPKFWAVLAFGVGASSLFTIIDYIGIYNFPFVNEIVIDTDLGVKGVTQASGFFPRRSAMAAVFSLSIGGFFLLALLLSKIYLRFYYFLAGTLGSICLMLTHNRSGILGITILLLLYLVFSKRYNLSKKIGVLILSTVGVVSIVFVMVKYFPSHLDVYVDKLAYFFDESTEVRETDYGRILILQTALNSLAENPLGNGFTKIPIKGIGLMNPHNIITSIVWAAGVLGILWLIYYAYFMYKDVSKTLMISRLHKKSPYIDAILVGLGAWLLGNMVHNSLSTGLAWVFLGILLSFKNRSLIYRRT